MTLIQDFLFIALPYVAAAAFVLGSCHRFRTAGFQVSALSSQFLESRKLFWGSVPFHVGMLAVLALHLAAFLIPEAVLAWNSDPLRVVVLEVTGFLFALGFLIGLTVLLVRRLTNARIRAVTTWADIAIEVLLLFQVVLGCYIAVRYRWGSSWFASDLAPYLWSLARLNPQVDAVKAMPPEVQAHIATAFLIFLVFPFTRLIHALAAPLHYLLRPYQQVIWNWDRKSVNRADSPWSPRQPKNT